MQKGMLRCILKCEEIPEQCDENKSGIRKDLDISVDQCSKETLSIV